MHSIWKLAGNVFLSTENRVANIPKSQWLFFGSLEICSQIPLSGQKAQLRIFHCSLQNHIPHPSILLRFLLPSIQYNKGFSLHKFPRQGQQHAVISAKSPISEDNLMQNNLWLLLPPLQHTFQPTHAPSWTSVTCSRSIWLSHFTAWPCSSQQRAHSRGAPCNGIRSALCSIFLTCSSWAGRLCTILVYF